MTMCEHPRATRIGKLLRVYHRETEDSSQRERNRRDFSESPVHVQDQNIEASKIWVYPDSKDRAR